MRKTSNASTPSLPRCSSFSKSRPCLVPRPMERRRMTAAQREAIYGDSPNAPQQTSNVSQAQAEAKQKALEREKLHQDALNSDTVAIDFSHQKCRPPGSVASNRHPYKTKTGAGCSTRKGQGIPFHQAPRQRAKKKRKKKKKRERVIICNRHPPPPAHAGGAPKCLCSNHQQKGYWMIIL